MPEPGTFLPIKHPNLKLAVCLLAASLLSACGGGSSSSSGAAGSGGSYDLGYAQGTAATLDLVLDDLQRLQASLAGSGGAVQTSSLGRAVTISVNSLNLEPRQRADLAARLETFIARLRVAQEAAAAASAGRAEADAAQAAADDALRALQLVVAADTAAQVVGAEAAQEAAITALTQIAAVEDPSTPEARTTIDRALNTALAAAQAEVVRLQQALEAARMQIEEPSGDGGAGVIADLNAQLIRVQASLTALRNARTARFGAPPTDTATVARASTTYHPRRTGAMLVFDTSSDAGTDDARTTGAPGSPGRRDARVFNPIGPWGEATEYDVTDRGTAVTDGFDLTPDAVLFNRAGGNRRVFAASSPNTAHFPGRGAVYRGLLRYVDDSDTTSRINMNSRDWIYGTEDRLVVQGQDPEPCSTAMECETAGLSDGKFGDTGTNANSYNNWDAPASMTFQYKTSGGFTMGFGGEGVIFGDLERYAAKGGKNCGPGSPGTEYCDESTTTNVELSFGAPQADPYGQPSTNYWYVQTPSPRLPAAAAPDLSVPADQIANHDMGRYEMILSANAQKDDGADRRLAYAAYGLSRFIDFTTSSPRVGRMQTFHYGLDAFADADGRRATELTGNDKIEGTFHGKTAAWIVTSHVKIQQRGPGHFITNLFRARGDIELRACIGDSNCTLGNFDGNNTLNANQVAGFIRNLEYAHQDLADFWVQDGTGGVRQASDGLRGDTRFNRQPGIRLNATAIEANGTYSGVTDPQWIEGLRKGTYEGAFYGPVGRGMEAAGTWRVGMAIWQRDMDAIIGSFGAICEGDCQPAASP